VNSESAAVERKMAERRKKNRNAAAKPNNDWKLGRRPQEGKQGQKAADFSALSLQGIFSPRVDTS